MALVIENAEDVNCKNCGKPVEQDTSTVYMNAHYEKWVHAAHRGSICDPQNPDSTWAAPDRPEGWKGLRGEWIEHHSFPPETEWTGTAE